MKTLAIFVAILFAWFSGVGACCAADYRLLGFLERAKQSRIGSAIALTISLLFGLWAGAHE